MLFAKPETLANWSDVLSTKDWVIVNSDDAPSDRIIDPRIPLITVPQNPIDPQKCDQTMFTNVHLIIVLVNVRTAKQVLLEFFEDKIRIFGHGYPNANSAYRQYGLYFLYDKRYMNLPKNFRPTAFLVTPTIEDLRKVGLVEDFLRASQPDKLCTTQKKVRGDEPFYHPDYAAMVQAS